MTTKRFSTFEGVFTPCLLSILGVIMYLRLGYVVGSVGFGGALLIICFANAITLLTALSMSSVVTNIRIGDGGAYSIISKSLGLEAGGAIGIPLYIAQAISIAFYVTGFAECWQFIYPQHPVLLVSIIVWLLILVVSYASAKLAFRIQYVILTVIIASLISIVMGAPRTVTPAGMWDHFSLGGFWPAFAIFFPAVTGILAGASMSGELKEPRVNIPKGTIWAIVVSFGIYVFLAYWFMKQVPLAELSTNTHIAIDLGRWQWLVVAGIMGATLSSAMVMTVGSPRILLALGKHSILPFSSVFSRVTKRGEPTVAILFTALVSLITILMGTLDEIASLLTMFFLITYGMINMTVFIEESIGIASFRPMFRVPRIFPLLGTVGCISVMFLINETFSLIAIVVIIGIYLLLLRRSSHVYAPDVRSGILVFLAEQFAKSASRLPYYPKIWKPNLLIPIRNVAHFERIASFVSAIVTPSGRVTLVKVLDPKHGEVENKMNTKEALDRSIATLKDKDIFVETAAVEASDVLSGSITVMQTVNNLFFPPNTLFYPLGSERPESLARDKAVIEEAVKEGLGIIVSKYNQKVGFSQEEVVNLWIRRQSPNINLAILIALQLEKNWDGIVRLVQAVDRDEEREEARAYLEKLKNLMRMPNEAEIEIMVGNFMDCVKEAPPSDINIFGMAEHPNIGQIHKIAEAARTSILFLRDSEHESALA